MRKTLLMSVALVGMSAAAFAQTPVVPGPTPESGPAPAMQMGGPPASAGGAGRVAVPAPTGPDIRPGHVPGVGDSFPASNRSSNIGPGDTHSRIAPRLPAPAGGQNAGPHGFLMDAQNALNARQTGRAQEALERAETAMLQRAVPADQAGTPDQAPDVVQVAAARDALARHDVQAAQAAIAQALTVTQ
jgi:hypothetical protein